MQIIASPLFREYYEYDWLKFLMGEAYFNSLQYYDPKIEMPSIDTTLLITSNVSDYTNFLNKLFENGKKYGVILPSDEWVQHDDSFIWNANCVFLYRNYLHPISIESNKVTQFGLGYRNGFKVNPLAIKRSCDRKYCWNFIGSPRPGLHDERMKAISLFRVLKNDFVHLTSGFNASDYLGVNDYQNCLMDSQFTLCPRGHRNIDTFRLYEALEAGSIPVTLKNSGAFPYKFQPSYWELLFKNMQIPFIYADSWEDALSDVQKIINEDRISEIQVECLKFWNSSKNYWKEDLQKKIGSLSQPKKFLYL